MGAIAILPRLIGLRKSKELVFTGKLVDGSNAAELVVETLRNRPTANTDLAKEAIHDNLGQSWGDGLKREARLQSMSYDTDAHDEGVGVFLNGRKPDFDS